MTPEGLVKRKVDALLAKYPVYYFKPVQMGLGSAGLDYHCVVRVGDTPVAFFIETKRPGGKPTDRQEGLIRRLRGEFRANVFVIDGIHGLGQLEEWLKRLGRAVDNETANRTHNKSVQFSND